MAKSVAVVDHPGAGLEGIKSQPERLVSFLRDVRNEMRKVITPTRAEVQSTTLIVLATVVIFAAYFWVVDTVIGQLIERAINGLTVHH